MTGRGLVMRLLKPINNKHNKKSTRQKHMMKKRKIKVKMKMFKLISHIEVMEVSIEFLVSL